MGAVCPGAVRDHLTCCLADLASPGGGWSYRRARPAPCVPARTVACAARAGTPRAGVAGGVSTVSTAVAASTAASP